MRLTGQHLEVRHRPKDGIDGHKVRDVIAKVRHGALVDGTQPDCLHTEVDQVLKAVLNAWTVQQDGYRSALLI